MRIKIDIAATWKILKAQISHGKLQGKNIFWSNANQLTIAIFAIATSSAFARLEGKEMYGQFLFVLSIGGLFSIFSIPGLRTVILRSASQNLDGTFWRASMYGLRMSFIATPFLLLIGAYWYISKDSLVGMALLITAIFFPLQSGLLSWISFLKGKGLFRILTVFNILKSTAHLAFILFAILNEWELYLIILGSLFINSSFNAAYTLKLRHWTKNSKTDTSWKKQGYALSIMDFSSLIFGTIDVILLGILLPMTEVAIYGLVMKISDVFLKFVRSTIEAYFPRIYDKEEWKMRHFFKFGIWSLALPLLLYFFVPYPVNLLYGSEYADVTFYSRLYLFVIPVFVLASLSSTLLIKHQLNFEINIVRIISIGTVLACYITLIPVFGIMGGIVGSFAYYIAMAAGGIAVLLKKGY